MDRNFNPIVAIKKILEMKILSAEYDKQEAILRRSLQKRGENVLTIAKNLENVVFKNKIVNAEIKKLSAEIELKTLNKIITETEKIADILTDSCNCPDCVSSRESKNKGNEELEFGDILKILF